MYQKFIGIDIGKMSFYVAIHREKVVREYANDPSGYKHFRQDHKEVLKVGLVVLETTGGYEMALTRFLQSKGYAVHRANTRKVKHFIRSYGRLGKSDTIDALGLAHYGFERSDSLPLFVENERQTLLKLVSRRNSLKHMLVQEKNRLKAPEQEVLHKSYQTIIQAVESEIKAIEERIAEIYADDPDLAKQKEVLKTITGIGEIIATNLLALMPELGHVNRKQIASLAGLAPHPNESGKKIGYRFTRGGRQNIKPVLFMAAMSAARSNSELGKTYDKFIKSGKKKMVALTALMRKMLVIANARMRDYYLCEES